MVDKVRRKHGPSHQVAAVFHPDAEGETLETDHGSIRVCKGEPGYQLATGEKYEI